MRIGLGTNFKQQPFAEYTDGMWYIWTSFNPDVSSGTCLRFAPDGTCEKMTINNNTVLEVTKLV